MDLLRTRVALVTALLVAGLLFIGVAAAQVAESAAESEPSSETEIEPIEIIDEAGVKHAIARDAYLRLPRQSVKVTSYNRENEFEGVSLVNLLESAGVKFGDALKGRRASTVAILEAADKYRVVVPLLDVDPLTTDRLMLVVDKRDGELLDDQHGPYRLIIPGDKRGIRWIRSLRTIRVMSLADLPLRDQGSTNSTDTPQ